MTSEISRSQQRNLEDCLQKISEMITEASQQKPEPSEEDIALRTHRLESMKKKGFIKKHYKCNMILTNICFVCVQIREKKFGKTQTEEITCGNKANKTS